MLSLTYLSSAAELWSDEQLEELLGVSRARNERTGVTGMLLYSGGNFIQTLEGPSDAVEACFSLIDADPRHHGLFMVRRDEITARAFSEWSMGFRRITQAQAEAAPGFTDYLDSGRIEGEQPRRSAVTTFHRVFREHIR